MIKYYLFCFSFVMVILFSSCVSSKEEKANLLTAEIFIDGSSTVFPLTEAVCEGFVNLYPDVHINIIELGTRGGFRKFSRSLTDINNASRPIKADEAQACKDNNVAYLELEVAYDGLAIVVNLNNTWAKDITVSELKKLWAPEAEGKITRWNQIRSDWPDKEIHLFGAGINSGTFDFFTQVIVGNARSSRTDYIASEYDNVLVQGIASDELALGYFGLAYFENNKNKLKLLPVDDEIASNGNGAVIPNIENVNNKTYSPLSRPLFIYVNSKSLEREEVRDFVTFYIDNAEPFAAEVGYIPLTMEQNERQQNQLDYFLQKLDALNK